MEKLKKLVLKKETLIAPQENQLRGISGGMAAMSVGSANENINPDYTTDSCILTCQPPPVSCCKKTCNGRN
jgi:hypothetical protein